MTGQHAGPTQVAYDAFAHDYDLFTAHHDYEHWTGELQALAERNGLAGRCLLDVGCGTGKSFLPFLARGWRVTACDLSPRMLEQARRKANGRVALHLCDARELPVLGTFDLVCCLDDVANYLTEPDDLVRALRGMALNLAPHGLLVFDANTLATYRGFFAETLAMETSDRLMLWRGRVRRDFGPGDLAEATLDVFHRNGRGWDRNVSRHLQRHHPEPRVRLLLEAAGLECVAVQGQFPDVRFERPLDEERHSKAIYVGRLSRPANHGRR